MSRTASYDHATLTKGSFLFGVGLFALGGLGGFVAQTYFGPQATGLSTLLVDAEAVGIAIALLAPLLFGIVLPLVE
ncbi:MAG: hypothetical protein ABEI96_00770 [Haloarculaceae archaeon]